ncbi:MULTISPECIES: hypothetical protein [unclassified Bradyrhizobium]
MLAILLTGILAGPANANWQYTKWGMTPDQVIAASRGEMKKCDATCSKQRTDTETALTYAKYRSGEFSFTAFAFFGNSSNRLEYVELRLDEASKAYRLLAELKSKYGEPTSQSNTQLSTMGS